MPRTFCHSNMLNTDAPRTLATAIFFKPMRPEPYPHRHAACVFARDLSRSNLFQADVHRTFASATYMFQANAHGSLATTTFCSPQQHFVSPEQVRSENSPQQHFASRCAQSRCHSMFLEDMFRTLAKGFRIDLGAYCITLTITSHLRQ